MCQRCQTDTAVSHSPAPSSHRARSVVSALGLQTTKPCLLHEDLRLENLSELPISTRRFAIPAAEGSRKDLRLFVDRMGANLRPRYIFPIFFANLDPGNIPSVDQLDPDSDAFSPPCIPRIIITMQAMTTTRRQFLKDFSMAEISMPLWERVWAWLDFFHTYEEALPDLQFFRGMGVHALYPATILDLQADPATAALINATPAVLSILSRSWNIFLQPDGNIKDSGFRDLCQLLRTGPNAADPANLAALVDGSGVQGGSMTDLAAMMVRHIYRVQPGRLYPMSDTSLFFLGAVVKMLKDTGSPDCPLGPALLSQGIVGAVTTVLCTYSEHGAAVSGTMDLLHDCFAILESLGVFSDKQWVAEALDAGLLRAIVVCGAGGFEKVQKDITRLLKDLLPPFSISHSLLYAFEAAVDGVRQLTAAPSFKTAQIYPAWDGFAQLLKQRVGLRKKYDNGLFASLKVRACDNTECPHPGLRSEHDFMQCRGCVVSVYCSEDCQVADWRDGHREICQAIQAGIRDEPETLTARDRSFLRVLVNWEFQRMKHLILLQYILAMYTTPGVALPTVRFNYVKGPAETYVLPTEDTTRRRSQTKLWGNLARASKIQFCAPVIVTMKMGFSEIRYRYFLMRPFSAALRDGLQRIANEVPPGSDMEVVLPTLRGKVEALYAQERQSALITW